VSLETRAAAAAALLSVPNPGTISPAAAAPIHSVRKSTWGAPPYIIVWSRSIVWPRSLSVDSKRWYGWPGYHRHEGVELSYASCQRHQSYGGVCG
jgi:hypothetical protein